MGATPRPLSGYEAPSERYPKRQPSTRIGRGPAHGARRIPRVSHALASRGLWRQRSQLGPPLSTLSRQAIASAPPAAAPDKGAFGHGLAKIVND
jgi:hypothetical protein